MSKKNKKSEIIETTETKNTNKNVKVKGVAGLRVAQAICYLLTFPVIIAVAFLICWKIGDSAPYYSFWPYIGAIIMGVFGLIFFIVALIVNRKGTKRKAMQRTVSMLICVVVLTGVFGLAFDVVLPDTIQNLTSKTLFVEDAFNNYEEKADEIIGYVRQYARLNLVNGNYDGRSYDVLTESKIEDMVDEKGNVQKVETNPILVKAAEYALVEREVDENGKKVYTTNNPAEYLGWDGDEEKGTYIETKFTKGLSDLDIELYDWIYTNYIMTDYNYAFAVQAHSLLTPANDPSGYNTVGRHALCRALVEEYSETYKKLCNEGLQSTGLLGTTVTGNEKLSWLFAKNYASMDLDGYLPLNDDAGLGYATGDRMTIPVVLRLILNEHYTVTDTENLNDITVIADGGKATTISGYFVYMCKPEIVSEIENANSDIEYDAEGRSVNWYKASDGNYYYVYNEGGYVEGLVAWCVLDMLGDPMAVATIDNLGELLTGLVKSLGINTDVSSLINGMLSGANMENLLNEQLVSIIQDATFGQKLYLTLGYNDQGQTEINIVPQAIELGYLGYQYMSWLELGHLLVTICGVLSLRNLLYIFGAVSVVMVFAIGTISAQIEKKKEEAEKAQAEAGLGDEVIAEDEVLDEVLG